MLLPAAFDKNARENSNSHIGAVGNFPNILNVILSLKFPIADVPADARRFTLNGKTGIRTLQGVFDVSFPSVFRIAKRMVIVQRGSKPSALQIHSSANAGMSNLKVVVVKNRNTGSEISGQVCGPINQSDIPVGALLVFQSGPKNNTGLQENSLPLSPKQGDYNVRLSRNAIFPSPEYVIQR